MDKCHSCGRSSGSSEVYECFVCKKKFCDECRPRTPIFGVLKGEGLTDGEDEKLSSGELFKISEVWKEVQYADSVECAVKFVADYRRALQEWPDYPERDKMVPQAIWVDSLPKESAEHFEGVDVTYRLWFATVFDAVMGWLPTVVKAEYLERVGRFEEAATEYEFLGRVARRVSSQEFKQWLQQAGQLQLYLSLCKAVDYVPWVEDREAVYTDRARLAREKSRQVHVKETIVDINKLLEQVRDGGIVAVYRCPHCGGKVKIGKDASIESLKVCEHCGTEIEAMDLADFIRTALS